MRLVWRLGGWLGAEQQAVQGQRPGEHCSPAGSWALIPHTHALLGEDIHCEVVNESPLELKVAHVHVAAGGGPHAMMPAVSARLLAAPAVHD